MNTRLTPNSKVSSLSPGRIALGYAVVATLWIAFSDVVVTRLNLPPSVMTIKGSAFVFVTAALLYFTIRRLVQFVQLTSEALRRSNRELRAISNCNQVLLRATDEQSLLQEICRIVCEDAGYRGAWVGYAEHNEAKSVRHVASAGVEEGVLAKLGLTWADTEFGRGPCGTALRTGKTSYIEDCVTDSRSAPWREIALQNSFHSVIALPLKDEQANTFGCLIIYSAQINAFTSQEIRLLEELAGDLAFGIVTLHSRAARERAEQKVSLLDFSLDRVRDAAFLIDEQGRCQYANESGSRILGYNRAELLGLGVADIDPDFPAERWPDHWRELKAQQSLTFESRLRTRDGRIFPVEISTNFFEYEGRGYSLALVRDITERKRAEDALRRSEANLAEGQRLAHMGSWAWDPATHEALYWSEEMYRIFGLNSQDGVPTAETFWQRVHPEDLDRVRELLMSVAHRSMDYEHDHRIVLRDGTIKHIHVVGHPVLDANGQVVEYVGTAVDVTERKRTEVTLRESEANLNRAQEIAHIGSWHLDITPNQLAWSNEVYRIFGRQRGTGLRYEDFLDMVHPEDRELVDRAWAAALQGAPYDIEHRVCVGEELKWVRERAQVEFDPQGKAVEGTGTVQDITERRQAEEELRKHREHLEDQVKQRTEELAKAKARAEAANRAKSTFLANMSHELRTPLNAVLGFSRLLKTGPDVTPHQQETLDIIVRSGEHLLNLVNNVLDMAKIESGKVVLDESEVDLHRLLHEIQSLMGVGASEKGLPFTLESAPDLPRFVAMDAGKLRQVLLNLVGNAIKYTDSGGVKLRARLASQERTEKAQIRFEVEDSGPGISPEDCQRIFSPFEQGSQASAQAGTGLGLAICKQYVELMGGQIGITSQPGKGSVFYFSIPVSVLPSVAEPEEPKYGRIVGLAEGQPRYRLLIVEDQPENRLLLRRLLEPLGFELCEAENGQEAVALFEQWRPNLIWMDIRMPVMDGLEAVRRIRAIKAGADTRIIALTAHALEEEGRAIMTAGFDDLVRKPFREHEIFDALARHLGLKFIHEQTPHQESSETSGFVLRPEQLEALPAQLLQDLRQAVLELDTVRTQALIQQVAQRDASLGRALNTLATQLGYTRLLKSLKKEQT